MRPNSRAGFRSRTRPTVVAPGLRRRTSGDAAEAVEVEEADEAAEVVETLAPRTPLAPQ
jgi:hypothetical protein